MPIRWQFSDETPGISAAIVWYERCGDHEGYFLEQMTDTEPREDAASDRLTADRGETKFLVPPDQVKALIAELSRHIPPHRFRGKGANELPGAHHHVTTVYFDTPSRDLFRIAAASDTSIKLRAKEYYDLHPSLVELATNPRQLVRFRSMVWLELKYKEGTRTGKRRLAIPKGDAPAFFAHGTISPRIHGVQRRIFGAESEEVLAEVARFCGQYPEPFGADCLVNYRRLAWQDANGSLRLTVDLGLAFFAPPADLWTRSFALLRETLGEPRATEPRAVVEVKTRGEIPRWLPEVLDAAGAKQLAFSKFEAASRAVHG